MEAAGLTGRGDVTFGVTLEIVSDGGDQHVLNRCVAGCKVKVVETLGTGNELDGLCWGVDLEHTQVTMAWGSS